MEEETNFHKRLNKRLAVTSEPSSGQRLDDQAVKDLVSSEKLTARNLHRDPISFLPTHKILIVGNWEQMLQIKQWLGG